MLRNQIKYCFPFVLCAVVLLLCGPASLPAAVRKAEGDSVFYRMYLSSKEKGDMEEAMENAAIFLESMDTSFVSQSASALAIELSEYLEDNFKFSKALQWRLLARKSQDISELQVRAENEYRLARLYYRTGQYDKAFEYGTAAQEMFSEIGDRPSALRCINLLGAVYYVCKDFDNSNLYFRRFAQGAEEINDSSLLIIALNNIAVYTNTVSDSAKTRSLISRCIDLCKGMNDTSWLCKMYINISASYVNGGNFSKAKESLSMAAPFLSDIEEYGQYYHYMGVIDYLEKDKVSAIDNLITAVSYYEQGEFPERQQSCLELLQELYASGGDFKDAYDALHRYYEISRDDRRGDAVIDLFRARGELMEQSRREEQMAREKDRAVSLAVGISLVVLIGAVGFIVFKRREYDISRREQELASKNEIAEFKRMSQYKTDMLVEETIGNLNRLGTETEDGGMKSELARICNVLRETKDRDEWKEMKAFVPKFNSDFYKNLIQEFPSLTINERRLCVFLNMNLTTKEISDITRQSVQSINTARGRLRKKLGITGDTVSIQEFLSKFN